MNYKEKNKNHVWKKIGHDENKHDRTPRVLFVCRTTALPLGSNKCGGKTVCARARRRVHIPRVRVVRGQQSSIIELPGRLSVATRDRVSCCRRFLVALFGRTAKAPSIRVPDENSMKTATLKTAVCIQVTVFFSFMSDAIRLLTTDNYTTVDVLSSRCVLTGYTLTRAHSDYRRVCRWCSVCTPSLLIPPRRVIDRRPVSFQKYIFQRVRCRPPLFVSVHSVTSTTRTNKGFCRLKAACKFVLRFYTSIIYCQKELRDPYLGSNRS